MKNQKNTAFQMIADIEGDYNDMMHGDTPEVVPVLPVRNLVLFPGVVSPILIGRESSKALIQQAERKHFTIGVVTQRDPEVEVPLQSDLYETGVYAKVVKLLTLPNGNITAIVQAQGRLKIEKMIHSTPYLEFFVSPLEEIQPEKNDREFKTACSDLREQVERYIEVSDDIPDEAQFAVKNITTAEGGAICLNMPAPFDNQQLYQQLRMMALNCQTKDAFTKSKAGGWRYDIVGMGMKANMADVNAAIGLAQIRQYDKLLAERKRIFTAYNEAFSKEPWAMMPPVVKDGRETSYHVYALRIKDITEEQRDEIIAEIAKKEVAVNVHFTPLPMLTLFRDLGYDIKDYPQAYQNYAHEISLPCYPQLNEEMTQCVIDAVIQAYHDICRH